MKKTICILLALAGLLFAQQGGRGLAAQDRSRSGASEPKPPLSRINLNTINSGQKSHFKVYYQAKQLKLKKQFSKEKGFEPLYGPFFKYVQLLQPTAEKAAKEAAYKLMELKQAGAKDQLLVPVQKRVDMYASLVKLCKDAQKAYKENHPNQLNSLMEQYKNLETMLVAEGASVPKRDWLSPVEAELLIREYTARKNAKN